MSTGDSLCPLVKQWANGRGYLGESRRPCRASKEEWGRKPDHMHCSIASLETLAVSKASSVLCSMSLFL